MGRMDSADRETISPAGIQLRGAFRKRAVAALQDDRRNVLIVVSVALLIRAIFFAAYTPTIAPDSGTYLDLAHRIAAGNLSGYNGLRTPGYPLLLLAVHYSPRAIWLVQSLVGVVISVLIYRLVRRLSGGPLAALVAALWYAVSLRTLATERDLITETFATLLMLVSGWLAVLILDRGVRSRGLQVVLGVVLAAFCMTRPDAIVVTVYLVLALMLAANVVGSGRGSPRWRTALQSGTAMLLPAVIVILGWSAVNRSTTGVFTVSSVMGHNMIDHVAPQVTVESGPNHGITAAYVTARNRFGQQNTLWPDLDVSFLAERDMERVSHLTYAHLNTRLLSIALGVMARHPLPYLGSSVKQWPFFWIPPKPADTSAALRAVGWIQIAVEGLIAAAFLVLCALHVATWVRGRSGLLDTPSAVLAGMPLVASLPAVFLAYGEPGRYGLPSVPLILAVTFANAGVLRRRGRIGEGFRRYTVAGLDRA